MIGAAEQPAPLVEPLSDFVRRSRIPFFNTQMGKGAVTGGSNLYLGTAALSERDYVHDAIDCRGPDHRHRPRHRSKNRPF